MNIHLTDAFNDVSAVFQINAEQVKQTILTPDTQKMLEIWDLRLGFFLKRFTQQFDEFYILACCFKDGEDWRVDNAFKILPELLEGAKIPDPFILLQQFVQRFGLFVRIGDQLNKFIMKEEIAIEGSSPYPQRMFGFLNPMNHALTQFCYIMPTEDQDGKKIIKFALVFVIDIDEYSSWLLG